MHIPSGSKSASITAKATIECLRNLFVQLGLPEKLVLDNGPTFVIAEFKDFLQRNGVKHITTSPYHLSSNGLAEQAVQTFKNGLRKRKMSPYKPNLLDSYFSRGPHHRVLQVYHRENCCLVKN